MAQPSASRRPLAAVPVAGSPTIQPKQRARPSPLIGPVRCPVCYARLAELRPVLARSVEVAEIVARRGMLTTRSSSRSGFTRDRAEPLRDLSSAELARVLSTRRQVVSARTAGEQLARAARDGLLRRRTLSGGPSGGLRYLYRPHPRAVAYLRDQSLAFALARALGETAERLQAALTVSWPHWWTEG